MHAFILTMLIMNPTNAAIGALPANGVAINPHALAYATFEQCNTEVPKLLAHIQGKFPTLKFLVGCVDAMPAEQEKAPTRSAPEGSSDIVWRGTVPSLIHTADDDNGIAAAGQEVHAVLFEFTYNAKTLSITQAQAVQGYVSMDKCHASIGKWAILSMGGLKSGERETFFCVTKRSVDRTDVGPQ